MQMIIDGVLYDTSKSDIIYADVESGRTYYKTPNSRFFVLHRNGNIEVLVADQVKTLLGRHDVQMYIKIFGEVIEG